MHSVLLLVLESLIIFLKIKIKDQICMHELLFIVHLCFFLKLSFD
jgi:hypothetical protein